MIVIGSINRKKMIVLLVRWEAKRTEWGRRGKGTINLLRVGTLITGGWVGKKRLGGKTGMGSWESGTSR